MRPWIVSALFVGVVVAGVMLWWPDNEEPRKPKAEGAVAPRPLTDWEVRTYITVAPEVQRALFQTTKRVIGEWEKRGEYPDDAVIKREAQAAADLVLLKHKLTRAKYAALRTRVQYVVDVIRYENNADERKQERDAEIRKQEEILGMTKEDSDAWKLIEKKIDKLKAAASEPGPPLAKSDRTLAKRYWKQLEAAVPSKDANQKRGE